MRRREFTTLVGGVATWPIVVRAQQPVMPVIGCLNSAAAAPIAHLLAAFRQGLGETGYIEGRNVAVEYRLAEGQPVGWVERSDTHQLHFANMMDFARLNPSYGLPEAAVGPIAG